MNGNRVTTDDKIGNRAKELIKFGEQVVSTKNGDGAFVNLDMFFEFKASSLSFLKTVFKENHPIYVDFSKGCETPRINDANRGLAILKAASKEIEDGWLATVNELISAELFSDFLEMADYLLVQKYKDPAAVIIGSVLEEHLRKLCQKNGIETELEKDRKKEFKKADRLNSDLYAKTVYNKLDNKSITTWLDLRNKAAHGQYVEYNFDQVTFMYEGVLEFITRVR